MKKRECRKLINLVSVVAVVLVAIIIIASFIIQPIRERADTWLGLEGELSTLRPGEILVLEGLYAYYKFDGNARDEFGVFNGKVHGASLTTGVYGQAYEFDSKGGISGTADYTTDDYIMADEDYINIPFTRGGGLDFSNRAQVTTSFWLNLAEIPSNNNGGSRPLYWEDLAENDGEESIEWFATDNGDGTYSLNWIIINHLGEKRRSTCENIPYGEWHMFAGVFGGNVSRIHKDGVLYEFEHLSGLIRPTTSGNDWVVSDASADKKLGIKGKIDEVRIYNKALTSHEVEVLFSEGTGVVRDINHQGGGSYSITLNIFADHLLYNETMIIADRVPNGTVIIPDSWSIEPAHNFDNQLIVWVFPREMIPETINYQISAGATSDEFRGKWGLENLGIDGLIKGDDSL